jgi:hypothetical protein
VEAVGVESTHRVFRGVEGLVDGDGDDALDVDHGSFGIGTTIALLRSWRHDPVTDDGKGQQRLERGRA